jgi:sugar-specific transcriptional regulator TrmB
MIKKIKELILSAEKEIYISSNIDITEFKDEIIEISQRGIRLTVVSFKEYHGEELPIDTLYTYVDEKNRNRAETIMIVVDGRNALVGEKSFDKEESSNIITDNPLLVSVIYKNILNNIYHLKLRDNIAFKLKDM